MSETIERCERHPDREGYYAFASHYVPTQNWRDIVRSDQTYGPFCMECRSEFLKWACHPAPATSPFNGLPEAWEDLQKRLIDAVDFLEKYRKDQDDFTEKNRIQAKVSGIELALDYMRAYDV